jgi:hypothetical protein
MWWVANATPWLLNHRERDRVPILQEAGWALGPVWRGEENLISTGIRSPESPARSELLYQLSYPDPCGEEMSNEILLQCNLVLKCVVIKQGLRSWARSKWLRRGPCVSLLRTMECTFSFHRREMNVCKL